MTYNDSEKVFNDLPDLIPLKKKKPQDISVKPANSAAEQKEEDQKVAKQIVLGILGNNLSQSREPTPKAKITINPTQMREVFPEKLELIRKQNRQQNQIRNQKELKAVEQTSIDKDISKTKRAVNQMINRTGVKNVAQQVLPISTQTINKNIQDNKREINALYQQKDALYSQMMNNTSSNSASKEIKEIEKSIQKLVTMNILYIDKLELRSENKRLLTVIQQMRQKDYELNRRVVEGVKKIQENIHYLPCDREKNLMIELERVKLEFKQEHEMRINLEENISKTIQNFARLYEEADVARKIIVTKLRDIERRQEANSKGTLTPVQPASPFNNSNSKKALEENIFGRSIQIATERGDFDLPTSKIVSRPDETQKRNTGYNKVPVIPTAVKDMNLEDKITRMRNNQATFHKMRF